MFLFVTIDTSLTIETINVRPGVGTVEDKQRSKGYGTWLNSSALISEEDIKVLGEFSKLKNSIFIEAEISEIRPCRPVTERKGLFFLGIDLWVSRHIHGKLTIEILVT